MTTKSPAAAGVYKPREDGLPLVETDMVDPASPDRGKLDTENYLRMLAANTDGWFGWCAFRPTHLCGPGNYNLVRAAPRRAAPPQSPGRIRSPARAPCDGALDPSCLRFTLRRATPGPSPTRRRSPLTWTRASVSACPSQQARASRPSLSSGPDPPPASAS